MEDATQEWYFVKRPDGEPSIDCFEHRETDRPDPRFGELLVRVRFLSVDPYMRGRMRESESYAQPWAVGDAMRGGVVGEVVDSRSEAYEAGDLVTGRGTWAEYTVLDADEATPVDPDAAGLPAHLGVLGMPGRGGSRDDRERLQPRRHDRPRGRAAAPGRDGHPGGDVAARPPVDGRRRGTPGIPSSGTGTT